MNIIIRDFNVIKRLVDNDPRYDNIDKASITSIIVSPDMRIVSIGIAVSMRPNLNNIVVKRTII